MPGLPDKLKKFQFDDNWALILKIYPYRGHLLQAKSGLKGVHILIDELIRDEKVEQIIQGRHNSIYETQNLIDELLFMMGSSDPVK